MVKEYLQARITNLNFYRVVPLYYKNRVGKFVLYKPAGIKLHDMRIKQGLHPEKLYIKCSDKIRSIREVQKAFNQKLKEDIESNKPANVKETIVNIVEETFTEPRSGSLEGISATVNILVSDYAQESKIVKNLLFVSKNDYTTVLHSVNVMALAIGYASHENYSIDEKKILGLSALLHDVGKAQIDSGILKTPRRLSDEEYKQMQKHTIIGYQILKNCGFANPQIMRTALQHHEKMDGSGYPNGSVHISRMAQIVAIIDCYEALTNDDRPYRSASEPLKALTIIKDDVEAGKFNKKIFEKFAYSLL
jgi:putative nucleotidyltransferase with HDIG domain